MKLILLIILLVLFGLLIWGIISTRKTIDNEIVEPDEVALVAEFGLDDTHKIGKVLRQTWDYFDTNLNTDAITEIRSVVYDRACLVTEKIDENGRRVTIVTFIIDNYYKLPDYPMNSEGQPEVIFEGPSARNKAEAIIKKVLKLTNESRVSYQLAGTNGPEHYFDIINHNE